MKYRERTMCSLILVLLALVALRLYDDDLEHAGVVCRNGSETNVFRDHS